MKHITKTIINIIVLNQIIAGTVFGANDKIETTNHQQISGDFFNITETDDNWEDIIIHLSDSTVKLDFYGSNYNGHGLETISKLKHLKKINLRGTKMDPERCRDFFNALPNTIQELDLGGIKAELVESINLNELTNLLNLDLSNNILPENKWNILLNQLPEHLESIDISFSNYTGRNIELLITLPAIKKISFKNCRLSEDAVEQIDNLLNNINKDVKQSYSAESNSKLSSKEDKPHENIINENLVHEDMSENPPAYTSEYPETSLPREKPNPAASGDVDSSKFTEDWDNVFASIPLDTTVISFANTRYTGENSHYLLQYRNLKSLDLTSCYFTSENWEKMIQNIPPCITSLILTDSNYMGQSAEYLKNLPYLEELLLDKLYIDTEQWLKILESLPCSIVYLSLKESNIFHRCFSYEPNYGQLIFQGPMNFFNGTTHKKNCKIRKLNISNTLLGKNDLLEKFMEAQPDTLLVLNDDELKKHPIDTTNHLQQELQLTEHFEDWKNAVSNIPLDTEVLSFANSTYTGENSQYLLQLRNLKSLDLTGCYFTSENWEKMIQNIPPTITSLILTESNYKGQSVEFLEGLRELKTLAFSTIALESSSGEYFSLYHKIIKHIPLDIRELSVYGNGRLPGATINMDDLFNDLRDLKLKKLKLTNLKVIKSRDYIDFPETLTHITMKHIIGLKRFFYCTDTRTDYKMKSYAAYINLEGCSDLTEFISVSPNLTHLNLKGCSSLYKCSIKKPVLRSHGFGTSYKEMHNLNFLKYLNLEDCVSLKIDGNISDYSEIEEIHLDRCGSKPVNKDGCQQQ